jgi:hypothetical protein
MMKTIKYLFKVFWTKKIPKYAGRRILSNQARAVEP